MYNYRRVFFDYEKEEQWLNDMSKRGLEFVSYSLFKYTFVDSQPGKYIYRIELLDQFPSTTKSRDYIEFCQGLGIDHVGSHGRWVFFKKLASQGPFQIFSDSDSIKKHYRTIGTLYAVVGFINVLAILINVANHTIHHKALPLLMINLCLGLPLAYFGIKFLLKSRTSLV